MTDVGELVPLGVLVRDEAGALLNANTVTLTITKPDLTIVIPPVANPPAVTGTYVVDYVPDQPGPYRYRWVADRPSLVFESSFDVEEPGSVGLISLDVAKDLLRIPRSEHSRDDDLLSVVRAATAAAEGITGRVLARRVITENRFFRHPVRRFALARRPVLAVASVTRIINGAPVLIVEPPALDVTEHGIVQLHGMWMFGQTTTTYTAGPAVTPPHVREAVGYIVGHLWANREGSTTRPRIGGQAADTDINRGASQYSVPNRAKDLLGSKAPLVG